MDELFEKICERIDGFGATKIKTFVVLDETCSIDVYISYEKEGIDLECRDLAFSCFGYDRGMKLATQVAERYNAELVCC